MKTLQMSNVLLHPEMEKYKNDINGVFHLLDPVISRLAMLNPLWKFIGTGRIGVGGGHYTIAAFEVKLDGELLGEIDTSYMGSRGRVICISNERIGKSRTRSSRYRTADADKAISMAKKMFGRMNPNERIQKAREAAEVVVTRGMWNKDRERNNYKDMIKSELKTWSETRGFAMFMEYIEKEALPSITHKVRSAREKLDTIDIEMKTIEQVQKDFGEGKTALVVKDSGKYLVRIGDNVNLYDDNSLPVDMRMKLGMLKLVENEQYITDMGCKVTDEIFVLLVS
jgi:hypothetical protein